MSAERSKAQATPQPASVGANQEALEAYARLLASVRSFFAERACLEVCTPTRIKAPASDLCVESFACDAEWLRTSPEFEMKRLLMGGSGDIYQIGPVFRKSEVGVRHREEFTMLEWYRVGKSYEELLGEVAELLGEVLGGEMQVYRYRDFFKQHFGEDPFECSDAVLQELATSCGLSGQGGDKARSELLDFLFTVMVENPHDATLVHTLYALQDFPPEQSSFAKASEADGKAYAQRFEVFYGKLELANGYQELTDVRDYLQQVESNNRARLQKGMPALVYDSEFARMLERGLMPESAGVSVGIERVLMCLLGTDDIAKVLAFA